MSNEIKQVFYCFTMFDNVLKKRVKCNCNTLYGARRYRNELLMDKRYSAVSSIFTSKLEVFRYE